MTTASRLWHCDEMRFGLWGQVRRRWGLKGKKIIQPMQIVFRWSYLVLAVDVGRGELHWGWSQGMNQQQLVPIFEQWPMDGVVWDGAPSLLKDQTLGPALAKVVQPVSDGMRLSLQSLSHLSGRPPLGQQP